LPRPLARAWKWIGELRSNEKWRLDLVETMGFLHRLMEKPPVCLEGTLDLPLLRAACAELDRAFHVLEAVAGQRVEELADLYRRTDL
jgi:hypothetical protein